MKASKAGTRRAIVEYTIGGDRRICGMLGAPGPIQRRVPGSDMLTNIAPRDRYSMWRAWRACRETRRRQSLRFECGITGTLWECRLTYCGPTVHAVAWRAG
jgi:hypothetical protein